MVALPDHAYIPGQNSRHCDGLFDRICETATPGMNPDQLARSQAWQAGHFFYSRQYFWEAHEVWEAVWMACVPNSIERYFVQTLIQIANGRLKILMGKPKAAERIALRAVSLLNEVNAPVVLGINTEFPKRELEILHAQIG